MAEKDNDLDFELELEGEEIDLQVEDDTPEADRDREPMPEDIVKELEDDELEDYSDKVKAKLKQLKKVWHDERRAKERALRENQEAVAVAERAMREARELRTVVSQGEQTLIQSFVQSAELELAQAKRDFRAASEEGDHDKLTEAQQKISEATVRLSNLKNYRPTLQQAPEEVEQPKEQPAAPKIDSKTAAWQERNQWYGTDTEMTASALGLHQKLLQQHGVNYAGTDAYWETIDKTMRRRFPEYFDDVEAEKTERKPEPKPSAVVAPATRSTSAKKIVLKRSQIDLAKKLGLTPEQYARELAKMER